MLETANTTEMHRYYDCAHACRAAAFRAALVWLARLLRHEKGPRQVARPLQACACA